MQCNEFDIILDIAWVPVTHMGLVLMCSLASSKTFSTGLHFTLLCFICHISTIMYCTNEHFYVIVSTKQNFSDQHFSQVIFVEVSFLWQLL